MTPWPWLAGGAVVLLFGWLALGGPAEEAAAPPMVKAVLPSQAAPTPAAASEPAPRGIRVHGVLFRGERAAGSQALLSVEGQAAQPFRVGDAVAQGWSLDSVAPDHVVLALGSSRARLDVTYSVRAPDATPAAAPGQPVPVSLPAKTALPPGLTPAPAGAGPVERPAVTGNRRFLEDRMKRKER